MAENATNKSNWQRIILILLSLVGVISLVVAQIGYANTATKLEVTLFNTLQLLLSLAFSWLLATGSSERIFHEKQRKFAMAAFRRIKEIERSLLRLDSYVRPRPDATKAQLVEAISMIRVGLAGAQDNVHSSIADWSEVIGSEIEVAHEISRLKSLRGELGEVNSKDALGRVTESVTNRLSELDEKIQSLRSSLPKELLSVTETEIEVDRQSLVRQLDQMWKDSGQLRLTGYFDGDSFDASPDSVAIGETIYLGRGITEHRDGPILAFDIDGGSIGVVLNEFGGDGIDYDIWIEVICEYFNRSLLLQKGTGLVAKMIEIHELREDEDGKPARNFELVVSDKSATTPIFAQKVQN